MGSCSSKHKPIVLSPWKNLPLESGSDFISKESKEEDETVTLKSRSQVKLSTVNQIEGFVQTPSSKIVIKKKVKEVKDVPRNNVVTSLHPENRYPHIIQSFDSASDLLEPVDLDDDNEILPSSKNRKIKQAARINEKSSVSEYETIENKWIDSLLSLDKTIVADILKKSLPKDKVIGLLLEHIQTSEKNATTKLDLCQTGSTQFSFPSSDDASIGDDRFHNRNSNSASSDEGLGDDGNGNHEQNLGGKEEYKQLHPTRNNQNQNCSVENLNSRNVDDIEKLPVPYSVNSSDDDEDVDDYEKPPYFNGSLKLLRPVSESQLPFREDSMGVADANNSCQPSISQFLTTPATSRKSYGVKCEVRSLQQSCCSKQPLCQYDTISLVETSTLSASNIVQPPLMSTPVPPLSLSMMEVSTELSPALLAEAAQAVALISSTTPRKVISPSKYIRPKPAMATPSFASSSSSSSSLLSSSLSSLSNNSSSQNFENASNPTNFMLSTLQSRSQQQAMTTSLLSMRTKRPLQYGVTAKPQHLSQHASKVIDKQETSGEVAKDDAIMGMTTCATNENAVSIYQNQTGMHQLVEEQDKVEPKHESKTRFLEYKRLMDLPEDQILLELNSIPELFGVEIPSKHARCLAIVKHRFHDYCGITYGSNGKAFPVVSAAWAAFSSSLPLPLTPSSTLKSTVMSDSHVMNARSQVQLRSLSKATVGNSTLCSASKKSVVESIVKSDLSNDDRIHNRIGVNQASQQKYNGDYQEYQRCNQLSQNEKYQDMQQQNLKLNFQGWANPCYQNQNVDHNGEYGAGCVGEYAVTSIGFVESPRSPRKHYVDSLEQKPTSSDTSSDNILDPCPPYKSPRLDYDEIYKQDVSSTLSPHFDCTHTNTVYDKNNISPLSCSTAQQSLQDGISGNYAQQGHEEESGQVDLSPRSPFINYSNPINHSMNHSTQIDTSILSVNSRGTTPHRSRATSNRQSIGSSSRTKISNSSSSTTGTGVAYGAYAPGQFGRPRIKNAVSRLASKDSGRSSRNSLSKPSIGVSSSILSVSVGKHMGHDSQAVGTYAQSPSLQQQQQQQQQPLPQQQQQQQPPSSSLLDVNIDVPLQDNRKVAKAVLRMQQKLLKQQQEQQQQELQSLNQQL